ncbi:MAG: chloride channel protein [Chthoniobacterales bacterium]
MSRLTDTRRLVWLSFLALGLGAVMAPVSQFLLWLIGVITSVAFFGKFDHATLTPIGNHLGLGVILVPVIGGLIVGLMARFGSPAIRGHGIPEAMEQVLENASRIPARITWLKPLSAAISIGTGGPFGAEGPIIATGGAGGSLVGQVLPTSASDRKTLLAAGAAAGMAATFGSPLSAVLLAIELLLFEFKARSLVPVILAVTVATAIRAAWIGSKPVFAMPQVLHAPTVPAFFALLAIGAVMGLLAFVISKAVYFVEENFEKLPVHWMWWPALGAIAVGMIGFFEPRTLGVGYSNITLNLAGALPATAILALCSLKFLSWSIALGSGTSGGTLAPLMTIGSGLGLVAGVVVHPFVPSLDVHLAALVGMACVFGGASQAILASAVFAYETTGQTQAIFPILASCAVALLVVRALGKTSIMTEKIERRGVSVPAEFGADVFEHTTVGKVMEKEVTTIASNMPLLELARRVSAHDPVYSRRHAHPVVDDAGRLIGIITRGDLMRAVGTATDSTTVLEAASQSLVVTHPAETLHIAIHKLLLHDIGRLPVVDPQDSMQLVGYLSRAAILSARWKQLHEETSTHRTWVPWRREKISSR